MDSTLLWQILLQIFLIGLNAIFACAEIAVISMNDNKLAQMAAAGDKRAVRLARLTSQPAKFLATIQVAITLSGFLGSAFAADNFSGMLVDWVVGLGVEVNAAALDSISVIIITLILSYFTLVFGELVPKRVAMKKAEFLALAMSGLISIISKIFAPIVWTLTASTNCILKLIGIDPDSNEDDVSEEDIRMMVDVGNQKGVIDIEEKEMIQNVFEFDNTNVGNFATHRKDIDLLWLEDSDEDWDTEILEKKHSKYLVCGDTVDHVIGVLSAKEYYRLKDKARENVLAEAVKPAYFIPESLYANVLFKRMKTTHNHFAVVLDEYGGVMGIVTMNDLLEQLVGDLDDDMETANKVSEIEKLDDNTWAINGNVALEMVGRGLGISLPIDEYDTFSGYVLGTLGVIPDDGAEIELETDVVQVRAIEIREHRVEKAIVTKIISHEDRNS